MRKLVSIIVAGLLGCPPLGATEAASAVISRLSPQTLAQICSGRLPLAANAVPAHELEKLCASVSQPSAATPQPHRSTLSDTSQLANKFARIQSALSLSGLDAVFDNAAAKGDSEALHAFPGAQEQKPAAPAQDGPASAKKPEPKKNEKEIKMIEELREGHKRHIARTAWLSREKEMAIGNQYANQFIQQNGSKIIRDHTIDTFINTFGNNLADHTYSDLGQGNYKCHFYLVDDPHVNAFALPGCYIFVNTGTITYTRSEDELAAVLTHELGHVTARHFANEKMKGTILQLAVTAGSIFLPPLAAVIYPAEYGLYYGVPLMFLKFSRDQESEADHLGLQYLYLAGYKREAAQDVFARLAGDIQKEQEKEEGKDTNVEKHKKKKKKVKEPGTGISGLFMDHPPSGKRAEAMSLQAKTGIPDDRNVDLVSTSQFDNIRQMFLDKNEKLKKLQQEAEAAHDEDQDSPDLKRPEEKKRGKKPTLEQRQNEGKPQ